MSFAKDLLVGENAQKEFAKLLLDNTKEFRVVSLEFAQGRFKDWDIKIDCIPDGILTYEIKADIMAQDTGNFVIEYRYKGNPSGIFTSKADYIVYNVKGERWVQERGELILRLLNTEKKEKKGGDGWNSSLWIISCDKLPDLFNKMELNEPREETI